MGDQRSRLGAANLSVPLMILTFVSVAGFLWWLSATAVSREIVVDETPDRDDASAVAVRDVTVDQLQHEPGQLEGQVVRVSGVDVATVVGEQTFFLDVPQSPFLVKLGDDLVARGGGIPQGSVTVVGPLLAMTDSILQDWLDRGVVPEADALLIEFATHFIEATSLAPDADDDSDESGENGEG